jgi:hypothetical protein
VTRARWVGGAAAIDAARALVDEDDGIVITLSSRFAM